MFSRSSGLWKIRRQSSTRPYDPDDFAFFPAFFVNLRERSAFFRALTFRTGCRTDRVTCKVAPRIAGETKCSFVSLVKYSIRNITPFTTAPMQIMTLFGFLMPILVVGQAALHRRKTLNTR